MSREIRELICELCRGFYAQGWVSGTGGGISIREGDRIFMAPSGVQKERIAPEHVFELDMDGKVVAPPPAHLGLKLSECAPLFMAAYHLRGAGAVIHSHSINALMATVAFPEVFHVTGLEMMKGIRGTGLHDRLEVPIIENTPYERDLTGRLTAAIEAYPKAQGVLVRRHGVYIWGKDWVQAKTQAECYDYLFEAAVRLKAMPLLAPTPKVIKWPHRETPTADSVAAEMRAYGYQVYDLQTIPPHFERSRHAHDEAEIRGAVSGVTTFHFNSGPITLEAGDILLIPAGVPHAVKTHNAQPFSAYKGSLSGERKVTELGDGQGSVEALEAQGLR